MMLAPTACGRSSVKLVLAEPDWTISNVIRTVDYGEDKIFKLNSFHRRKVGYKVKFCAQKSISIGLDRALKSRSSIGVDQVCS